MLTSSPSRAFKTAGFSKAARKAHISDAALCQASQEVWQGQADDLGGGVCKKRLNENRHRSILLAMGGPHWIYQYLFAKKDRANIDDDELVAFRMLAKSYAGLTQHQLNLLLADNDLVEICHDNKQNQLQK